MEKMKKYSFLLKVKNKIATEFIAIMTYYSFYNLKE